ncbi:MAG: sugar kinase [Rhizobiaceae bacterium]
MANIISCSKNRIACVGEVMIEIVMTGTDSAALGVAGDTFNTAVYLKHLLKSLDKTVSYFTAIGTDSFSTRILSKMTAHGIDTSNVEIRPDLVPGMYAIDTDGHGERSFSYWRSQSAARTLFAPPCQIEMRALKDFDIVYISGISMAILPAKTRSAVLEFLREYRKTGGLVAFDSNFRPQLWEDIQTARRVASAMWALSDIALPSIDDEMALFGDTSEHAVVERLRSSGVSYGALKRGASGPLDLSLATGKVNYSEVTNIVDTTAAGDSFNAGFLASNMRDETIGEALQAGHRLASKVIQKKGAIVLGD